MKSGYRSIPFPDRDTWSLVRKRMRSVKRVVDIGPGIRPQELVKAETHICIEPHEEYVRFLATEFVVIQALAIDALQLLTGIDTIVMLDVIEHMEKAVGAKVIALAKQKAASQVLVYTPNGFEPQQSGPDGIDKWGYYGGTLQNHCSGWDPSEFNGWDIILDQKSFFAIWTR